MSTGLHIVDVVYTKKGNVLVDLGNKKVLLDADTFAKANLVKGTEVPNDRLLGVLLKNIRSRLYRKGYTYLSRALKPRKRLEDILKRAFDKDRNKEILAELLKEINADANESIADIAEIKREMLTDVADRLEAEGLLDDELYAEEFVRARLRNKPRSTWILIGELVKKGIDREIAKAVVERQKVNDKDLLKQAYLKKMRSGGRNLSREKMIAFLRRKGFNYYDIVEVIDEIKN